MGMPFYFMLLRTASLFDKELFSRLEETGLTEGQLKLVDYIGKHPGCKQKDVAAGCKIAPSTATIMLSRMEEDGIVERRVYDNNHRSFHIFLSERGEKAFDQLEAAFAMLEGVSFEGFTKDETDEFMSGFSRVYANVTKK